MWWGGGEVGRNSSYKPSVSVVADGGGVSGVGGSGGGGDGGGGGIFAQGLL